MRSRWMSGKDTLNRFTALSRVIQGILLGRVLVRTESVLSFSSAGLCGLGLGELRLSGLSGLSGWLSTEDFVLIVSTETFLLTEAFFSSPSFLASRAFFHKAAALLLPAEAEPFWSESLLVSPELSLSSTGSPLINFQAFERSGGEAIVEPALRERWHLVPTPALSASGAHAERFRGTCCTGLRH